MEESLYQNLDEPNQQNPLAPTSNQTLLSGNTQPKKIDKRIVLVVVAFSLVAILGVMALIITAARQHQATSTVSSPTPTINLPITPATPQSNIPDKYTSQFSAIDKASGQSYDFYPPQIDDQIGP